jgi:hypothetical protein
MGCTGNKLIRPKLGVEDLRSMVLIEGPDHFRTLGGEQLNIIGQGTHAFVILTCLQPFCFTAGDGDEEYVLYCETPDGELLALRRSEFGQRFPNLAQRLKKRIESVPVPISAQNVSIPAEDDLD